MLAPGWWVTSAKAQPDTSDFHCETFGQRGTSMAAPVAAGFAIKSRSYFVNGYYPSGFANSSDGFIPSGALLKAVLVHSGRAMEYVMDSDETGLIFTIYG